MGWMSRVLGSCLLLAAGSSPALADTYVYDALGRMVSHETTAGVRTIYTYDAAGNRTVVTTATTPLNTPPSAVDDVIVRNEGSGFLTIPVLANDTDPEALTLTVVGTSAPQFGTVSHTTSAVSYTGGASVDRLSQTDTFTYAIEDAGGLSDTAVIRVVLTNLDPVLVDDAITVPRNGALTFDPRVNDSDPGGDPITITAVSMPGSGTATFTAGSVTYTTAPAFSGGTSFTYNAADGEGGQDTATVSVTVTADNEDPVAFNDNFGPVPWGQSQNYDVRVNDSDPDGDPLLVISVGAPTPNIGTPGVAFGGAGVFYQSPPFGYTGNVTFSYTISDGQGGTASAEVTVSVESGN